jgi:O-antigen/teichoic acid export membrane protein
VSAVGPDFDPSPGAGGGVSDPFLHREEAQFRTETAADAVGGAIRSLLAAAVALPLTIAANVVAARILGAEEYGRYAVISALMTLVIATSNWGVSDATVQWLAQARASGNRTLALSVVRRSVGYHLLIQLPIVGLAGLIVSFWLGSPWAALALLPLGLEMFLGTGMVILTATAMNRQSANLSLMTKLFSQVALVLGALIWRDGPAAWAASVAPTCVGPLLARRFFPRYLRLALVSPRFPRDLPSGFPGYAAAAGVTTVVGILVASRSEVLGLQALGHSADVGVFALAAGVAGQVMLPANSLGSPLVPVVTALFHRDAAAALVDVGRALRLTGLLSGLTAAALVPSAAFVIVPIYGSSFAGTEIPFACLAFVAAISGATAPLGALGFAVRQPRVLLATVCIALVVDLILVGALIPTFGLAGAVAANGAATLAAVAGVAFVARRFAYVQLKRAAADAAACVIGITAGTTSFVAVMLSSGRDGGSGLSLLKAGGGFALGIFTFSCICRVRRRALLTREDWDFLANRVPCRVARASAAALRYSGVLR